MADGMPLPTMDELIELHAPLLYRYAYRLTGNSHEAEDLTQQTYLLVQQRGHQLREVQALRGWLLRSCGMCSLNRDAIEDVAVRWTTSTNRWSLRNRGTRPSIVNNCSRLCWN